jgi:hypothetical protein
MEQTLALAPRWALLVDPAAAQSVIERMSKLELPRRVCRPLDRGNEKKIGNAEREQFDAAIEAAADADVESDLDWDEIEAANDAESTDDEDWDAL